MSRILFIPSAEGGIQGTANTWTQDQTFGGDVILTAGTVDVQDGGAVVQDTSRAEGVTLSKPTGKVTTTGDSLAAGVIATHIVTNTVVAVTDVIIISKIAGDVDTMAWVNVVAAGSFSVSLFNTHSADADVTAFVYNFVVIQGAIS